MTSEQRIEVLEQKVEALKKQLEDVAKSTSCSVEALRADIYLAAKNSRVQRSVNINCN